MAQFECGRTLSFDAWVDAGTAKTLDNFKLGRTISSSSPRNNPETRSGINFVWFWFSRTNRARRVSHPLAGNIIAALDGPLRGEENYGDSEASTRTRNAV